MKSRRDNQMLQLFVRDAMPGEWLDLADELHDAAELLWAKEDGGLRVVGEGTSGRITEHRKISSVSRPYMLLAGFALENLLKGLRVASDASLITSGRIDKLKSHGLLAVAAAIEGLTLSAEEVSFCRTAQEAIPYWGRYPVPLAAEGRLPEVAVTNEMRHVYLHLHQRLGQRLYDEIKDGWDSGVGPRCKSMWAKRYEPAPAQVPARGGRKVDNGGDRQRSPPTRNGRRVAPSVAAASKTATARGNGGRKRPPLPRK